MADTTKMITAYIAMRDDLAARTKAFTDSVAGRKADMLRIADELQKVMETAGSETLKVKGVGTAFMKTNDFISTEDWNPFLKFIATKVSEGDEDALAFFNKSVSKAVVKEYMKDNGGATPPGLTYGTKIELQVRKATK